MTSVSRGRGWSSKQDKAVPLRRPVEVMLPADMEVDALTAAVQAISLRDINESVLMLKGVEELIKTHCQTEEALRSVVQRLHDRSLEDRQFGIKAAAAYSTVAALEVDGVKLRNVLLMFVQRDYEDRAHLQVACNLKFLNAIALLGEIFYQVRLPDGSPINVLASAVLQYQEMLLSGEEHEMELFTTQLAINGRKLYDCRPGELEELILRVRTTIMSRNLSGQSRCWLLLALDLAANRYAPLSGQLQAFYQVHLGANAMIQLQRLQLGLTVDTSSHSHSNLIPVTLAPEKMVNKPSEGEGILAKCKANEEVVENGAGKIERTAKPSVGSRLNREDRAVDGTKYGKKSSGDDTSRRKKWQDGVQKEDIWGSTRGERTEKWGHDDRFVKDDDFYGRQAQRGEGPSRPRNREKKLSEHKVETKEDRVEPPPSTEEESWD